MGLDVWQIDYEDRDSYRVLADSAAHALEAVKPLRDRRIVSRGDSSSDQLAVPVIELRRLCAVHGDVLVPKDGETAKALGSILAERERQMGPENWSRSHDDQHDEGQLAKMACFYLGLGPWPFNEAGPRREGKTVKRAAVIAAALLVAEVERLARLGL